MPHAHPLATFLHVSDLHLSHNLAGHGSRPWDPDLPLLLQTLNHSPRVPSRWWERFSGLAGHHHAVLADLQRFFDDMCAQAGDPSSPEPVVICSGDLTQNGALQQFTFAEQFLGAQLLPTFGGVGLGCAGWEERATPGNHDHWPGMNIVFGHPFNDLSQKFNTGYWRFDDLKPTGKRLQLIRLNTDAQVNPLWADRLYARGSFNSELTALDGNIGSRPQDVIRVLIMHHSPGHSAKSSHRELGITAPSMAVLRQFLLEREISLVLTGHVHEPKVFLHDIVEDDGSWSYVEARCGTSAQLEEIPSSLSRHHGLPNALCTNSLMTHTVREENGRLFWQIHTYYRTAGSGFGDPGGTDMTAQVNGLNVRFQIWPVDAGQLRRSFTRS